MAKRTKITFESLNKDNYTTVNIIDVSSARVSVKEAMQIVRREYEKKDSISKQNARNLVLNA